MTRARKPKAVLNPRMAKPALDLPNHPSESLQILKLPHGGYIVRPCDIHRCDGSYYAVAAFTTLDEAMKWVKAAFEVKPSLTPTDIKSVLTRLPRNG